ncbi:MULTISPECIES: hypothetical protein [Serratia]|uniref:hypothetical protein n=1 Tax=Serratia TaxID=613 RepID=UPI0013DAF370|nr:MULTISPECIES: hypothetical protein [Serratia]CAI2148872.1 Uncharacterised protein [Serratia ficaria]CAI2150383.1 Uncharacterised protein [Serratia ficaria]CAI2535138.1 Uncharacterised protein [Serratia ficaria]HEI9813450.1 hypothetical protein [Serratia marcescens]
MNTTKNVSTTQGILLTTAVLLSGAATLWGYMQWDVLSALPLYWRNALVPLPLLVFMGLKHLQARLYRADEHE